MTNSSYLKNSLVIMTFIGFWLFCLGGVPLTFALLATIIKIATGN